MVTYLIGLLMAIICRKKKRPPTGYLKVIWAHKAP